MKYDFIKLLWAFCGVCFADGDGSGGDGDGDGSEDGSDGSGDNTVDGVEYTRDAEENYCLNNIPVLGADKVPFHNRAREGDKKTAKEHSKTIKDLEAKHAQEIEGLKSSAVKPPVTDPNADDPETGLLKWQSEGIQKKALSKVEERLRATETRALNKEANQNIDLEMVNLKNNPDFEAIFKNEKYLDELKTHLNELSLETALSKGIVGVAAQTILGRHQKEIVKAAAEEARIKALEGREIVDEVSLGKSSGASAGKTVKVTKEIRELFKDNERKGMTLEEAAGVISRRDARRAKKKQ